MVSAHGKGGVLENLAKTTSSKDTVWPVINSGAKGRQGQGTRTEPRKVEHGLPDPDR